jgi:2-keto-4-pentenoate hydratase/2-oxohepta-3-ene-1,7-dioic acid hydratase in catechol pathway
MRLVSYRDGETWRAGFLEGEDVRDAASLAAAAAVGGEISGVRGLLEAGRETIEALASAFASVAPRPLAELQLGPPVPDPQKVICLGLNYSEHAGEVGEEAPPAPILFAKFANALVGTGAPIVLPPQSSKVDYEAELAIVIGRRCKDVAAADAADVVAGAMPLNDVSARDLQMQTGQWTAGKAPDTFAPCGPALVLWDEMGDLQEKRVRCRLNGETLQDANTSQMIFPIGETIEFISGLITLEPGDVIATGTPSGVGFTREPPILLKDGDVVEVEIEGLGVLSNPVVAG